MFTSQILFCSYNCYATATVTIAATATIYTIVYPWSLLIEFIITWAPCLGRLLMLLKGHGTIDFVETNSVVSTRAPQDSN